MKKPVYSQQTLAILKLFGEMVRIGRLERKMPQADLALRINTSRQTVAAIEKGDPKVAIGTFFEAATIVGIPLFTENKYELQKLTTLVGSLAVLLPERIRKTELNDDF